MNRISTYLFFALLISFFFAVGNILNPNQGWESLVEEALGFILLLVGFLLFGKLVERLINGIKAKYRWNHEPLQRIIANTGAIAILSASITFIVVILLFILFSFGGTPKFVDFKRPPPPKHEMRRQPPRDHLRPPPKPDEKHPRQEPPPIFGIKALDDAFRFHQEIFLGSFALFCLLFSFEEMNQFSQRKEEERLRAEQLEKEQTLSKLNALRNQLNPHFMFNNLNTLAALISMDVKVAREFLQELSKTLRYVLEQNEAIVVPLKKELTFIESYLYLQKVRFGEKINVQITIHPDQTDYLLPPLTLELLIDNALKHNIVSEKQPILVEIFTKGNFLIVKNDYQPKMDVPPSTGIGLKNLRERLKLLELEGFEHQIINGKFVVKVPLLEAE